MSYLHYKKDDEYHCDSFMSAKEISDAAKQVSLTMFCYMIETETDQHLVCFEFAMEEIKEILQDEEQLERFDINREVSGLILNAIEQLS